MVNISFCAKSFNSIRSIPSNPIFQCDAFHSFRLLNAFALEIRLEIDNRKKSTFASPKSFFLRHKPCSPCILIDICILFFSSVALFVCLACSSVRAKFSFEKYTNKQTNNKKPQNYCWTKEEVVGEEGEDNRKAIPLRGLKKHTHKRTKLTVTSKLNQFENWKPIPFWNPTKYPNKSWKVKPFGVKQTPSKRKNKSRVNLSIANTHTHIQTTICG